jgi:hypothetical protein
MQITINNDFNNGSAAVHTGGNRQLPPGRADRRQHAQFDVHEQHLADVQRRLWIVPVARSSAAIPVRNRFFISSLPVAMVDKVAR